MDFRRPASEFPNDNLDLHDGAVWRCREVTGASRAIVRPPAVVAEREVAQPAQVAEPVNVAEIIAEVVDLSVAEIVAETGDLSDASPREVDPEVLAKAVDAGVEQIIGQAEREAVAEFIAESVGESVAEVVAEVAAAGEEESVVEEADGGEAGAVGDEAPVSAVEPVLEAASEESQACEDESAPEAFEALLSTLSEVALARGATRAAAVIGDLLRVGSTQADLVSKAGIDAGESAGLLVKRGKRLELTPATSQIAGAWRAALDGSGDLTQIGNSTLDGFCSELLATISADTDSVQQIRRELRSRGVAAFGLLEVAA